MIEVTVSLFLSSNPSFLIFLILFKETGLLIEYLRYCEEALVVEA